MIRRLAVLLRPAVVRPVLGVLAVGVVVGTVWTLPRVVGTTWSAVGDSLSAISPVTFAVLTAVWLAGQAAHTLVQTTALPGLRPGRALTLNLATSAVASGLPGGGPLSIAANWAILRSWGFTAAQFSSYSLVSTLVVAAAKLSLPIVTALVVATTGTALPRPVHGLVLAAGITLGAGAALLALLRHSWRPVRELVARSADVVRRGWPGLLAGAAGQLAAQYALFVLCLQASGAGAGHVAALIGFATGRVLSALPITPGGLGITETGAGAVLVALGADPGGAVAGVLLFGVFAVLLEIPVGAVALAAWWLVPRPPGQAHRCGRRGTRVRPA